MIIINGCIGCGQCADECDNIGFETYTAKITDPDRCKRCEVKQCLELDCPGDAISEGVENENPRCPEY